MTIVQNTDRHRVQGGQILVVAALALIWEGLPSLGVVDPMLLPPLSAVVTQAVKMLVEGAILGDLLSTVLKIGIGFVIVVPLGIATGLYLGTRGGTDGIFSSVMTTSVGVPKSIFLPIFIFFFGTTLTQKIVFAIPYSYPIIVIVTMSGVKGIDDHLILSAKSMGADERDILRHIYIPSAIPSIVAGLRLGLIFTVLGVIIAEMYVAQAGIGQLLTTWGRGFQITDLFAGILIVALGTIIVNESFRYFERRAQRWQA